MPFSKISEALALLQHTELCSDQLQAILDKLKKGLLSPAEACFQIFELEIGSESHATYAVCVLGIIQSGSTTMKVVFSEMKKLMQLHHQSIVAERPHREEDDVSMRDVAERIRNLVDRNLLRLGENETILFPK